MGLQKIYLFNGLSLLLLFYHRPYVKECFSLFLKELQIIVGT